MKYARVNTPAVVTESLETTQEKEAKDSPKPEISTCELQLLSLRKVCALVDASPASVWRWVKAGVFPKPIRLSPAESGRRVAWHSHEVYQWILNRPRISRAP